MSRAPVESTMRGSSQGKSGSRTGFDPAAMIACSNPIRRRPPSGVSTAMTRGPSKRPVPCTTSTLRRFARPASPSVRRRRPVLPLVEFPGVDGGGSEVHPRAAMSAAAAIVSAVLSRALEGMQPTLRQTPPRVGYRSTSTVRRPRSAARKAAV